ncbi:sensor histidine kinase [Pseudopontixanthobacter vadosimaris]|uniref:sensor histidine kinase n=1 Tax=Pseudopontixanthobacter vadosimaris TaxID=2726450 RepID=UPI001474ACD1|nr:sensor histidine kinase [Pseudopontixanthobacter vadosimaris]
MPHGMCLLWQPWLVMLWAGSDLLIFLSYMAIPAALVTVLRKRTDVPAAAFVVLFASFILLCGLTHLAGIVTLWWPIYPWIGALKLATGLASMITAIILFRLIPDLIALPSPGVLAQANAQLEEEVAAHEATLAALEEQVASRTEELRQLNAKLAVHAREAVHRSANLLSVVSSLAARSAKESGSKEEFIDTLVGRLRALAQATTVVKHAEGDASEDLERLVREQLDPLLQTFPGRIDLGGTSVRVGSEAAQQISLALHELATNAQKYSLSQSEDMGISIDWRVCESEHDADYFVLEWREQLAPGAEEPFQQGEYEGFGTKLLTRIIPVMLRGKATREFSDGEFVYRLQSPMASIEPDLNRIESEGLAVRLVDENFGLEPEVNG